MAVIDIILNLAALLLWVNFRATSIALRTPPPVLSIASAIKRTESNRGNRWVSLVGLFSLLLLRALVYWTIGSAINWTAILSLGAISLSFRSDMFTRMLSYSFVSFGLMLGIFYVWLLLISAINRNVSETNFYQRMVRSHLGFTEKIPAILKPIVSFVFAVLTWVLCEPFLEKLRLVPTPKSSAHLWEEALVIGTGTFVAWEYFIVALLVFHIVNSYVYLGQHPLLQYIALTGKNLLGRFALRFGKFDLAPFLVIAFAVVATEYGMRWLVQLYRQLPL